MWRLTSADKGRRDSKASFRYSEKNETGLQSVPSVMNSFYPPLVLELVQIIISLMKCMMGTSAVWEFGRN